MTDNQQPQNLARLDAAAPQTWNGPSRELSALLLDEPSRDSAIDQIRRSPALLAEAQAALPHLRDAARKGAGRDGVIRVLSARFPVLHVPEMTDGEWAAWFDQYAATCGDLPEAALEAAMNTYCAKADAEFMPRAGPLRALALEAPTPAARAFVVCVEAVGRAPKAPSDRRVMEFEPRRMPTDEERALVRRMADGFAAHAPPQRERREFAPPPPPVDEQGLSALMRETLARQYAQPA